MLQDFLHVWLQFAFVFADIQKTAYYLLLIQFFVFVHCVCVSFFLCRQKEMWFKLSVLYSFIVGFFFFNWTQICKGQEAV